MDMFWSALAVGALPFLGLVLGLVAKQAGPSGMKPRP